MQMKTLIVMLENRLLPNNSYENYITVLLNFDVLYLKALAYFAYLGLLPVLQAVAATSA
jgi:hypothetical protein